MSNARFSEILLPHFREEANGTLASDDKRWTFKTKPLHLMAESGSCVFSLYVMTRRGKDRKHGILLIVAGAV
jgi:hypothetical protein